VNLKIDQRVQARAPAGAAVAKVTAEPGEIRVTSAEKDPVLKVFSCFFYMH
jgi:hypothetical protein